MLVNVVFIYLKAGFNFYRIRRTKLLLFEGKIAVFFGNFTFSPNLRLLAFGILCCISIIFFVAEIHKSKIY